MDISITKSISKGLLSIVFPNDRLGKITNLFFITAPIVYVIGKSLRDRFSPPDTSQLTSSEKIKIRSLKQQKLVDAKNALSGKNDLGLWRRLVLSYSSAFGIPKGCEYIADAPENLRIKLYQELAIFATLVNPDQASPILQQAALLEKPQVNVNSWSCGSSFKTTFPQDQVSYLLDLAEKYRTFYFSSTSDKDVSKCFGKLKESLLQDSEIPYKEQYQYLQQLKKILRERSSRCDDWIQKVSAIQSILTDNSAINDYIQNEKKNKKEIDDLIDQLEKPDVLKTIQYDNWEAAEKKMTPLIQWKDAFIFDPKALIDKAIEVATALPENTSKELEERFSSHLKILKYLEKINDKDKTLNLTCQIYALYQRFLENVLISSIDKIGLCVEFSQCLSSFIKPNYHEEACRFVETYKNKILSEDKDLQNFKNLNNLIEELIKLEDYTAKEILKNTFSHAMNILKDYSPKDETGFNNKLNQFCRLVELKAKSKQFNKTDFSKGLEEIYASLLLNTTILESNSSNIYLKLASAYYNGKNKENAIACHKQALNAAISLPDTDSNSGLEISSCSSKKHVEPKFNILRKIYLQCLDQNNFSCADESIKEIEKLALSTTDNVKKIKYHLKIAKMHFGNTPMDNSPKGNPERTYPEAYNDSKKIAFQFESAIALTLTDEFKKLSPRNQVKHLEQMIEVTEHLGQRLLSKNLHTQAFDIAKTILDPKTEFRSSSSWNSSSTAVLQNKYNVYIRLARIAKELQLPFTGIIASIPTIPYSSEQVDEQIRDLCNAAEQIHAFMKKDTPDSSQYLSPIFNKISNLTTELYPKSPISIFKVQKYVSALEMFHSTQEKVNFVHTELNDRKILTQVLTLLMDDLPLSKGNFLSSSSQVKEITELKVRILHLLDKKDTKLLGQAMHTAAAYPKKEDQFEALSILAPLAYSRGLYDHFQQFIIGNLDEHPEKITKLAVTVAQKLAQKARNLPKDMPNYQVAFSALEDSSSDLFIFFAGYTHKFSSKQIERTYKEFTQCLLTFPELKKTYKTTFIESWLNAIKEISPSFEKKRHIEAFAEIMFKLGEKVDADWMTASIDECNQQINRKEQAITLTSSIGLWSLARIYTAPIKELNRYKWFCAWAVAFKLTNALFHKF